MRPALLLNAYKLTPNPFPCLPSSHITDCYYCYTTTLTFRLPVVSTTMSSVVPRGLAISFGMPRCRDLLAMSELDLSDNDDYDYEWPSGYGLGRLIPGATSVLSPCRPFGLSTAKSETWSGVLLVDWKEMAEKHVFKADVPGMKPDELKVEVEDGRVLRIAGEKRRENNEEKEKRRENNEEKEKRQENNEEKAPGDSAGSSAGKSGGGNTKTWHRYERVGSLKFERCFRLPSNTKVEEIKAVLENGVLTVTVPKVPPQKPVVTAIEISA